LQIEAFIIYSKTSILIGSPYYFVDQVVAYAHFSSACIVITARIIDLLYFSCTMKKPAHGMNRLFADGCSNLWPGKCSTSCV